MLPSEYVKRNCYITLDPREVAAAGVAEVGEPMFSMATDIRISIDVSKTVSGIGSGRIFRRTEKKSFEDNR